MADAGVDYGYCVRVCDSTADQRSRAWEGNEDLSERPKAGLPAQVGTAEGVGNGISDGGETKWREEWKGHELEAWLASRVVQAREKAPSNNGTTKAPLTLCVQQDRHHQRPGRLQQRHDGVAGIASRRHRAGHEMLEGRVQQGQLSPQCHSSYLVGVGQQLCGHNRQQAAVCRRTRQPESRVVYGRCQMTENGVVRQKTAGGSDGAGYSASTRSTVG